jgi:acetylserotonin O-methyltransferase
VSGKRSRQLRSFSRNLLDTAGDQQVRTSSTPALPRALELTVVSLVSDDFFVDQLPAADLYAVGRILHDWTEAQIEALLKRIYAALPEGGGLLIAEKLLQEDRSGRSLRTCSRSTCWFVPKAASARSPNIPRVTGFGEISGRITGAPLDAVLARKRSG